jgi:DNA-binding MarR family transcriptional regulator
MQGTTKIFNATGYPGIPVTELRVLKILVAANGQLTATAIRQASNGTITQAAVHVYANRLVKRGLAQRFEEQREFHGELVNRISYEALQNYIKPNGEGKTTRQKASITSQRSRGDTPVLA